MSNPDFFSENLNELQKLFPTLTTEEIKELRKLYKRSEECWDKNVNHLKNVNIKYLLICEAPPAKGNYFYCIKEDYLFKQVWKCFFGNQPICTNPSNAYQCLANIGFLLIDSLPLPFKYQSRDRKKPAYLNLIKSHLPIWVNKLNTNFTFSPNLTIAFGFKLNAHAVISASGGSVILGGIARPLTPNMIAATGAGQPSSALLAQKFGINWGAFTCNPCP